MNWRIKLSTIATALLLSLSLRAAPDVVKASSFGFNAEDATECLQAAINSGARKVIIDNVGKEWIVRPLKLRSNLELVFEDDVVLLAKENEFKARNASMFSGGNIQNVSIIGGKNCVIRMRKKDYLDESRYEKAEWRHGIGLHGADGFVLKNMTIQSTGGDGLYLGCAGTKACNNVLVENCVFDDNNRQGLTVIGSDNTLIKNCVMKNTWGTNPMAGIGIEPNNVYGTMTNLVFENCECYGNAWIGGYLHNWNLDPIKTPPISVTFINCNFHDNKLGGFSVYGVKKGGRVVHGTADFIRCNFTGDELYALAFCSLTMDGFKVTLKDCVASVTAKSKAAVWLKTELFEPYGNVDFGNLKIRDEVEREPIQATPMRLQGMDTIYGTPVVAVGDGPYKAIDLAPIMAARPKSDLGLEAAKQTEFVAVDYMAGADGPGVKAGEKVRLRGSNTFVQCVRKGTTARVHLWTDKLVERDTKVDPQKIVIENSKGKAVKSVMVDENEQVVELTSPTEDEVYMFKFGGRHPFHVWSEAPGHGMIAANLSPFCTSSTWYFVVPAALKKVSVMVCASELESAVACLYDANGKALMEPKHVTDIDLLNVSRQPTEKDEIWSIRFTKTVEDYSFTLMGDLDPIVFSDPQNVIIRKK